MQDPVAKDLVYIQAVHDVVASVYNVTQEEALKLAGLQVQVVYGNELVLNSAELDLTL